MAIAGVIYQVWRLRWYHSGVGRTVTADYGTQAQADERREFIQSHGDRCDAPKVVRRAMPK